MLTILIMIFMGYNKMIILANDGEAVIINIFLFVSPIVMISILIIPTVLSRLY